MTYTAENGKKKNVQIPLSSFKSYIPGLTTGIEELDEYVKKNKPWFDTKRQTYYHPSKNFLNMKPGEKY